MPNTSPAPAPLKPAETGHSAVPVLSHGTVLSHGAVLSTGAVLPAGVPLHPDSFGLVHEPVAASATASGAPSTGLQDLGLFGGVELGVWEMTEGGMYDTEAEEVFVVLSGTATVEFLDEDGSVASTHHLAPHTLMRFAAGTRTRWTVTSTLRKIYLTLPS